MFFSLYLKYARAHTILQLRPPSSLLCTNELNDIFRKFQIGPTSGKCSLTLMNLSKPRKLYFFVKLRVIHAPAIFNSMPVVHSSYQKHLGIYLDEKLNFCNHIKETNSTANEGIGILRKLYNVLPRNSLIAIY